MTQRLDLRPAAFRAAAALVLVKGARRDEADLAISGGPLPWPGNLLKGAEFLRAKPRENGQVHHAYRRRGAVADHER